MLKPSVASAASGRDLTVVHVHKDRLLLMRSRIHLGVQESAKRHGQSIEPGPVLNRNGAIESPDRRRRRRHQGDIGRPNTCGPHAERRSSWRHAGEGRLSRPRQRHGGILTSGAGTGAGLEVFRTDHFVSSVLLEHRVAVKRSPTHEKSGNSGPEGNKGTRGYRCGWVALTLSNATLTKAFLTVTWRHARMST